MERRARGAILMTEASPVLPDVIVRPASLAEKPLIEGLFQFYVYDWSELESAQSPNFEVDPAGRFADYPTLVDYWSKPGHWVGLVEIAGRFGGFILINDKSHRGGSVEHNMAEFFVLRKYRRGGVATAAFQQVLKLFPGAWEVAVAERNAAAKAFWEKAIAGAPGVSGITVVKGDGEHWHGPIWCFRV